MDHFSSTSPAFTEVPFYHASTHRARPLVAVSACLAGEPVRYDGASRDLPAYSWLDARLELAPICPEVGAGLAVPRPPVRLVTAQPNANPRAIGRDDPTLDVTEALTRFAHSSVTHLEALGPLCGYVFKSRSPSCGFGSTPLFDENGRQLGMTSGIQAAWLQDRLPWLSYSEDTDLLDREAALAFELRCRLVFDWLHAGDAEPAHLLRHYRPLFERLGIETRKVATDRNTGLSVLQRHCAQLSPPRLLAMFRDWAS